MELLKEHEQSVYQGVVLRDNFMARITFEVGSC